METETEAQNVLSERLGSRLDACRRNSRYRHHTPAEISTFASATRAPFAENRDGKNRCAHDPPAAEAGG